jgi:hypothetical protein
LRIEENLRSVTHVLAVANRLISANLTRYEPDKRLVSTRGAGDSVEYCQLSTLRNTHTEVGLRRLRDCCKAADLLVGPSGERTIRGSDRGTHNGWRERCVSPD